MAFRGLSNRQLRILFFYNLPIRIKSEKNVFKSRIFRLLNYKNSFWSSVISHKRLKVTDDRSSVATLLFVSNFGVQNFLCFYLNLSALMSLLQKPRLKSQTYPGNPPDSIILASVTSLLQTSYCHFFSPRTPHNTRPVCIPTLIFRLTSVDSHTDLMMKNM